MLATACLLAALTACSAFPADTSAPSGPAPQPALSDAPRVPSPKDLRGIPACDLLTSAQLTTLGFDPADRRTEQQDTTERCQYHARDYLLGGSVTSAHRWTPGGLDRLYLSREYAETFIPGTLDGFPTLLYTPEDTDRCELNVGVADDQLIFVRASTPIGYTGPSACDLARAMASAVLSNLPPLR